jgi:hypothetical protein
MEHTSREAQRVGNLINLAMGIWLILSLFAWHHGGSAWTNTAVLGGLIAACSIASLLFPAMSWFNALPGLWLFTAAWWLEHQGPLTPWNNALVAVVVLMASTAPLVAFPQSHYEGRPHARMS